MSPSNENNNQQPASGRHYNDPVQSAQSSMQQSSSASPVTVTQSHVPNNIRNENSNAANADHRIHQSSFHSTSDATEEEILDNNEGFSEQSEVPQSSSLPLAAAPEGSEGIEGIENCQDEEDDAPIPVAQIAARYESIEKSTKENKKPELNEDDDDSPPLPPWHIGCEDEDLNTNKSYVTSTASPPISDSQPSTSDVVVPPSTFDEDIEQNMELLDEDIEQNMDEVVPPSTSDEDIEQSIANIVQPQVEIIIYRPPSPSMLPRESDDEEEEPSADLPSLPQIEATAVEDVVYDAVAIRFDANQAGSGSQEENASWWKRNQKYLLAGLFALIIGALIATVATLVGSKDATVATTSGANDDANIVVPDIVQPTVPVITNLHYYADKGNNKCVDKDSSDSFNSQIQQRLFSTLEECCETE